MGSIIKMIGTLLSGIGLGSLFSSTELTPGQDNTPEQVSNWTSIIAIGGVGLGMLMYWILRKVKVIK